MHYDHSADCGQTGSSIFYNLQSVCAFLDVILRILDESVSNAKIYNIERSYIHSDKRNFSIK